MKPFNFKLIFVLALVAAGLAMSYLMFDQPPAQAPVFCTMDAKICPDGSAVGRSGPKCEFAACPNASSTCTKPGACDEASSTAPVRLDNIKPGQSISSPVILTGQALGGWYFEAVFPVTLLDANGQIIVNTYAQAIGEWMTPAYVPFTTRLEFTAPATATGTLIFHKDNPSGLPENDDSIELPVSFR